MSPNSQRSVECPYCGNNIFLPNPIQRRIGFSVGHANWNVNLSFDAGPAPNIACYNIHCNFCEKKYNYYDFRGNFSTIYSMLEFEESVLYSFKKFNIHPKNLGNLIVGVVEPKRKVYQNFARRVRERFERVGYKYIEIILKISDGKREKRCVIAGRMTLDPPYKIRVEQFFWIIGGED